MMGNLLPRQMRESKIKLIFVEVWTGIMFHNKGPAEYNLYSTIQKNTTVVS
jgi:hypothetical protein